MNERIEHITKQVDEYFDDLSIEFSRQAWMEKFAELIVRECAKVINADIEAQIKDGIISNVHGLNQARYLINEHFGVEE